MAITTHQINLIRTSHAAGLLDPDIARAAGCSIATVKRYRRLLGLSTNSVTAQCGKLGERITAQRATDLGLPVTWRKRENEKFDLWIAGRRVDAKAAMQQPDGRWRFRLPTTRPSYYGLRHYAKNYALDCDALSLVALYPDGRPADVYLLDSAGAPRELRIERGGAYRHLENAWQIFGLPRALQA